MAGSFSFWLSDVRKSVASSSESCDRLLLYQIGKMQLYIKERLQKGQATIQMEK